MSEPRWSRLSLAATVSLVVSGLSLAIYALTAFTVRDWTIAGPGLAVAVAGITGLRFRWAYLAGLAPISAVLTVAGKIAAFDLARPGETAYFIGTVLILISACFAAIVGLAAVIGPRRTWLEPSAGALALAACIAVFIVVIAGNDASSATDRGITAVERRSAVVVEMVDYRFVPRGSVIDGGVIDLRNTGTLPHEFHVPSLGLSVLVPAGRHTYVRLPHTGSDVMGVICPVGDHQQRGMGLNLPLSPGAEES